MKGDYLNLKVAEDRWIVAVLVVSALLLLIFSCVFTFAAPEWGMGGAR